MEAEAGEYTQKLEELSKIFKDYESEIEALHAAGIDVAPGDGSNWRALVDRGEATPMTTSNLEHCTHALHGGSADAALEEGESARVCCSVIEPRVRT